MASNTTKSDTGAIYGATYSAIIDGVLYVLKTVDHSLGVSGFTITDKNGQFAGGVYAVEPETVQVEIDAIAGIDPPSRFVPFEKAFHGFAAKYWMIHNLVIKSGNALGRTYLAELKQSFPDPLGVASTSHMYLRFGGTFTFRRPDGVSTYRSE